MMKPRTLKRIPCTLCHVKNLCLVKGLELPEVNQLANVIKYIKEVDKKEQIYDTETAAKYIYAINRGSCKEYWIDEKGNECITNFYLPGDIIGLESISREKYMFYTEALENTQVCVIPIDKLLDAMQQNTSILKRFLTITNYKMQHDQIIRVGMTAHQKICDFLLTLSIRYNERKPLSKKTPLSMSQIDIANFLGMTPETVNRIFNSLKQKKVIKLEKKSFQILNQAELESSGRLDYQSELAPSL